jgi:hypothetical protein
MKKEDSYEVEIIKSSLNLKIYIHSRCSLVVVTISLNYLIIQGFQSQHQSKQWCEFCGTAKESGG